MPDTATKSSSTGLVVRTLDGGVVVAEFAADGHPGAGDSGAGANKAARRAAAGVLRFTSRVLDGTARLLGGKELVFEGKNLADGTELHQRILKGLPVGSLTHLYSEVTVTSGSLLAQALGVSERTLRRSLADPADALLSTQLSSRTWAFAETLAKAIEAFGDRRAAEEWLLQPAMGLDGHVPMELLQTSQGAALVDEFLDRQLFGVYN